MQMEFVMLPILVMEPVITAPITTEAVPSSAEPALVFVIPLKFALETDQTAPMTSCHQAAPNAEESIISVMPPNFALEVAQLAPPTFMYPITPKPHVMMVPIAPPPATALTELVLESIDCAPEFAEMELLPPENNVMMETLWLVIVAHLTALLNLPLLSADQVLQDVTHQSFALETVGHAQLIIALLAPIALIIAMDMESVNKEEFAIALLDTLEQLATTPLVRFSPTVLLAPPTTIVDGAVPLQAAF